MRDLRFYNAGCEPTGSIRRILLPLRLLLRRLLLPFFERLVEILQGFDLDLTQTAKRQETLNALCRDSEVQAKRLHEDFAALAKRQSDLQAFQLDYDALGRRLAALEDHVELLYQQARRSMADADAQSPMQLCHPEAGTPQI
jgi:hypothetical protein